MSYTSHTSGSAGHCRVSRIFPCCPSVAAVSSPNYATPSYSSQNSGTLWFVDPADSSIQAYVDSVSITLDGYHNTGGWFDGANIVALDLGGLPIAGQTVTVQPSNGVDYASSTLTFTGQIHALRFDNIPNQGRLGILPFDDLTFGAETDAPEPSTMLLAGVLLCAAWPMRRRA